MFLKKINSRLKDRIDEHDADIEKMCNHHYQGFIYSVKELLHVKSDATQLKSDVVKIDTDLRESATSYMTKVNELVKLLTSSIKQWVQQFGFNATCTLNFTCNEITTKTQNSN